MMKSIILLCLTCLLYGAARARVEITRGRNAAGSAVSEHLAHLAPEQFPGNAAEAERLMSRGFEPASRQQRLMPHHYRSERRPGVGWMERGGRGGGRGGEGGGKEGGTAGSRMAWHRPRPERQHHGLRGHSDLGRAGLHRMAQSLLKAADRSAGRISHQQHLENLRADLIRYHQMARRGHRVRGQGRQGYPDVGRFHVNGPRDDGALHGRLHLMSHGESARGPRLNWFPSDRAHPGYELRGHGHMGGGHRGHHGMPMMGHGRFMPGSRGRVGRDPGGHFAAP